jgi:hypothetical protein
MTNEDEQSTVQPPALERDPDDAGIGVTSVIVMLAVLAVLVVGIFWALPAYFGGQVIEVTIRN